VHRLGSGLLEFRRGRGVTVAGTPERGAVIDQAQQLLEFARFNGYRKEDVIGILGDLP
jgi:GntR family transcriptional regulator